MMDGPLQHDGQGAMDPAVLPGLLARLAPAVAVELRRQFELDLLDLRAMLAAAVGPPPDLVAVARQAHGLIALAGTAGGGGLVARARVLLRAAQHGDGPAAARLTAEILPQIDALAALVAACPLP